MREVSIYFIKGFPMLIVIVLITLLLWAIINILPPIGIGIAIIATAIFAGVTLGIARELLDGT
jgi:hypothetical protein